MHSHLSINLSDGFMIPNLQTHVFLFPLRLQGNRWGKLCLLSFYCENIMWRKLCPLHVSKHPVNHSASFQQSPERQIHSALVQVAMVLEGKEVIKTGRGLIGATNPLASAPGTIRGDYGVETGRNLIHGSGEHI